MQYTNLNSKGTSIVSEEHRVENLLSRLLDFCSGTFNWEKFLFCKLQFVCEVVIKGKTHFGKMQFKIFNYGTVQKALVHYIIWASK